LISEKLKEYFGFAICDFAKIKAHVGA